MQRDGVGREATEVVMHIVLGIQESRRELIARLTILVILGWSKPVPQPKSYIPLYGKSIHPS